MRGYAGDNLGHRTSGPAHVGDVGAQRTSLYRATGHEFGDESTQPGSRRRPDAATMSTPRGAAHSDAAPSPWVTPLTSGTVPRAARGNEGIEHQSGRPGRFPCGLEGRVDIEQVAAVRPLEVGTWCSRRRCSARFFSRTPRARPPGSRMETLSLLLGGRRRGAAGGVRPEDVPRLNKVAAACRLQQQINLGFSVPVDDLNHGVDRDPARCSTTRPDVVVRVPGARDSGLRPAPAAGSSPLRVAARPRASRRTAGSPRRQQRTGHG